MVTSQLVLFLLRDASLSVMSSRSLFVLQEPFLIEEQAWTVRLSVSPPVAHSLPPAPPLIGPLSLGISLSSLAPSRRSMADGAAGERPLAPQRYRRDPVIMETLGLAPPLLWTLPLSDMSMSGSLAVTGPNNSTAHDSSS